jgi:hypothetical protein
MQACVIDEGPGSHAVAARVPRPDRLPCTPRPRIDPALRARATRSPLPVEDADRSPLSEHHHRPVTALSKNSRDRGPVQRSVYNVRQMVPPVEQASGPRRKAACHTPAIAATVGLTGPHTESRRGVDAGKDVPDVPAADPAAANKRRQGVWPA